MLLRFRQRRKPWAVRRAHEHSLDAIVSADGDGDRPLVSDETGEPLRGDLLGLIAAQFTGAAVAVTPITSNSGIERCDDFTVLRTRVGSPFVIAGMMQALSDGQTGVLGFEANGGVLTATDFCINGTLISSLPTRDSFLPVLAALAKVAQHGQPLSVISASYSLPAAISDRLENFPTETSTALMAYLRGHDANLEAFLSDVGTIAGVSDIDGLRVALIDGRIIHFRPSGNAPEMSCYVEAETESQAKALLEKGLNLLRAWADSCGA